MLQYLTEPISIKNFWKLLKHLLTMNCKKHDDSIYGAARYLANTLGIQIENNTYGTIDEVMSSSQIQEKWHQAAFSCKCLMHHTQQIYDK